MKRDYYSIPMQLTWRTGRIASAWRREQESGSGYYRNDYYLHMADPGTTLGSILLSILPSAFELHTGFSHGMMLGPLSREPYDGGFMVDHRFSCTCDLGARLIIPTWRFNLFADFTYHCYLTDNFRVGNYHPSRSFMGMGAGLSFGF